MTIHVLKRDGRREEFKEEKIIRTCRRIGATEEVARKIANEVGNRVYDGITTDEILSIVADLLGRHEYSKGVRYNLKNSLLKLGPSGFRFEKFVARLLEEYGYATRTNVYVKGRCARHEIDVIAEKDKIYLIECKFHNLPIYTGLKEVMYTYARFLDIDEYAESEGEKSKHTNADTGSKTEVIEFDRAWMFTNTKFSDEAKGYAECRGIRLTGWNYPEGEGIELMLEKKNLHPLSILRIDKTILDRLVNAGYVFCRDVVEVEAGEIKEKTGLNLSKIRMVRKEAKLILEI